MASNQATTVVAYLKELPLAGGGVRWRGAWASASKLARYKVGTEFGDLLLG